MSRGHGRVEREALRLLATPGRFRVREQRRVRREMSAEAVAAMPEHLRLWHEKHRAGKPHTEMAPWTTTRDNLPGWTIEDLTAAIGCARNSATRALASLRREGLAMVYGTEQLGDAKRRTRAVWDHAASRASGRSVRVWDGTTHTYAVTGYVVGLAPEGEWWEREYDDEGLLVAEMQWIVRRRPFADSER